MNLILQYVNCHIRYYRILENSVGREWARWDALTKDQRSMIERDMEDAMQQATNFKVKAGISIEMLEKIFNRSKLIRNA